MADCYRVPSCRTTSGIQPGVVDGLVHPKLSIDCKLLFPAPTQGTMRFQSPIKVLATHVSQHYTISKCRASERITTELYAWRRGPEKVIGFTGLVQSSHSQGLGSCPDNGVALSNRQSSAPCEAVALPIAILLLYVQQFL